jgi:hypothetical protein
VQFAVLIGHFARSSCECSLNGFQAISFAAEAYDVFTGLAHLVRNTPAGRCEWSQPDRNTKRTDCQGRIPMRNNFKSRRLASAAGGAIVGGIGGAMLAALGYAISSSPIGVGLTVILATLLGACVARAPGAIVGVIYGALFAAFGWAVGGSVVGAVVAILACAFVGGWIEWVKTATGGGSIAPQSPFRSRPERVISVSLHNFCHKELALWN